MITGGSNYITVNGSMDNPVIGTYHLNADTVRSDLQQMFEHGQRKIAFLCWYGPLNFPAAKDHLWHHVVDSYGGEMCAQHQQNVIDLLAIAAQTGFNEVHFRFGAQGDAADRQWTEWKQPQFDENWAFIDSVRDLVVSNSSGLKVVFDLAVEHAWERINTSQIQRDYCLGLWQRYVAEHGPDDSCAFSMIHGGAGALAMIRLFQQNSLPFPAYYFLDVYGYEYRSLIGLASVLRNNGVITSPVVIQETFYNDALACSDIKRAVSEAGINFQGVFQWPKVRGLADGDFPDVFPRRFDNYLVEV